MDLFAELPEPVRFALDALAAAGYEAALVGGCVRDALMGRAPGDYDVASSASPREAMRALEGEKIVPTGLKHGTILLARGGMGVEITSFREDGSYADMRRPDSVRFTRSLTEDVLRRDFTMNALAWEREAGLIDRVGGERDIRARLVRAVGDPRRRFQEDALRMLRALRFSAQLEFRIDESTRAALIEKSANLSHVSRERVLAELAKLISGPGAEGIWREYEAVLRPLIPCEGRVSPREWERGARRLALCREPGRTPDAALLWAALLFPAGGRAAGEALRALRADERTARGAAERVDMAAGLSQASLPAVRALIGDRGPDAARDALLLRFAFEPAEREAALGLWRSVLEKRLPCSMGEMAVDGRDLAQIGILGPRAGAALRALLAEVRADSTPNEKEALLKRAGELEV